MAKQEQLDILQRGAETWNTWRQQHLGTSIDLIGADLSGADLSRVQLSRADLSRADLSRANLMGAHLNRANLMGAHLYGATLMSAYLRDTDLKGTDLRDTDLKGTDLSRTSLSFADLSGAIISQTHFADIDLRNVKGLETIRHLGPSHISTSTLEKSGGEIPEIFLKGTGVGANLIEYAHSLFGKPIEYYTCFISYSSEDELFARRLHNDLQQEGVRCWFAPEDMDIGDKIRYRIDESIRLYDKLLLILSEHSIASTWVEYEVEQALNKEPQGIPNVLYPVRVDRTALTCTEIWVHEIKRTRHIGDFENWTDPQQYEKSFKRLLRALNTKKEQGKS